MVVAKNHHGHLKIIDRLREMVRLSEGLNASQQLDRQAVQRAIACLQRFGQRLRDFHADSVRVIGTNALRQAKNTRSFIKQAQNALGHPIEIISGIEEARLIYQGTTYAISRPNDRRIVVDIGGGSTEIIVGAGLSPIKMESLLMGCVSMSEQFFADGKITREHFDRALLAARLQLRPHVNAYRKIGWQLEIGASGTIKTISEIAYHQINGNKIITLESLIKIRDRLIAKQLNLSAVRKERLPVLPGGVAVLLAIFESLDIAGMNVSDGALREGVLFDLLGRLRLEHEDARAVTVKALQRRYHIDVEQAERVEAGVFGLLGSVKAQWNLTDNRYQDYLRWAARLHEIGLDIAHASYHKHGAYLLQHADMPGFAWSEQQALACLVGAHRRKIRAHHFAHLANGEIQAAQYLLVLLRLAVLLNRGRTDSEFPVKSLHAHTGALTLKFCKRWPKQFPLTCLDLQQESEYLKAIDFKLAF